MPATRSAFVNRPFPFARRSRGVRRPMASRSRRCMAPRSATSAVHWRASGVGPGEPVRAFEGKRPALRGGQIAPHRVLPICAVDDFFLNAVPPRRRASRGLCGGDAANRAAQVRAVPGLDRIRSVVRGQEYANLSRHRRRPTVPRSPVPGFPVRPLFAAPALFTRLDGSSLANSAFHRKSAIALQMTNHKSQITVRSPDA